MLARLAGGHVPPADASVTVLPAALTDRVGAEPGCLDSVLVAPHPAIDAELDLRPADVDHPRVGRARRHRTDVRVWTTADGAGLLTLGRGLAGR